MPLVRSIVTKMFGKIPYSNINPDEAVAIGAVVQGELKQRNEELKELVLTDVCPYSLGIGVAKEIILERHESGIFQPIIERNSPIPISRVKYFEPIVDNQKNVTIKIYQGESLMIKDNIKLGEICLELPRLKAEESIFEVIYTYDINGLLEVECKVKKTGEVKSINYVRRKTKHYMI